MLERSKVLIVDDLPENLYAMEELLKDEGVGIIKAANGNEALKATLRHDFALMILDVNMPEMDGFELAEILHTRDESKHVPIIFLTGVYKEYDSLFKGYRTGAVDYLLKPIDTDMFLSKIRVFVQLDRQKKALVESNRQLQEEVAERKQAEVNLRESEERLGGFIESATEGCVLYDSELNLVEINKTALKVFPAGTIKKKIIGRNILEISPGLKETGRYDQYRNVIKTGAALHFDNIVPHEKFGARHLSIRAFKVGKGLGVIFTDITERIRTAEELKTAKETAEAANHAKSVFLSNMSHELRTPLNAILGFAKVMDRSLAIPPDEKKHLAIIHRSGKHLLNLINDVLDMAKIDSGRTVLSEKDFDLYCLIGDLEDMFSLKTEKKGLRLVFECSADVPRYVRTDADKLHQVLVNLLGNAIKFTNIGVISVKIEYLGKGEQNLQFSVTDTGEGIAPDELDCLFNAFVQTETGRKSGEGTGLGLPISRKFVQMMGGDITVESEAGKGSVFRFRILAEAAEGAVIEIAQPEKRVIALAPDQPRYRILIADDIESNRLLLLSLLALPGFELRDAENGKEAMEFWEKWKPHLIFMDMKMPVMDGYEAAKKIKAAEKSQTTAIIAVTASAFEEERDEVLSTGCDDFVRKPYKESEIFDVLHKHLGVRYVYEKHSDAPVPETSERDKLKALTPEALAALPRELLTGLKRASVLGYSDEVERLAEDIRPYNAALADALAVLAADFDYDKILKLIPQKED